ncbi:MAG: SDR family NAD(P)-dependent oxidoreductase [Hyphomicrobiales bacterium]|nr:SDR family NAD(P)-dependent oxidoreductase [Hyphomicrobiales bacterium]
MHLVGGFLPGLRRAGKASIIIVSSGYALAPATRAPIYSASKAALHSLSKSLRRQSCAAQHHGDRGRAARRRHPSVAHRDVPEDASAGARRPDAYGGFERREGSLHRTGALASPFPANSVVVDGGRGLQRPEGGTGALARRLSVKGHAPHESRACRQRCNVARHKPNRTEKLDCAR